MTDDCCALHAAGPVVAGLILAGRKGAAGRGRAGQGVMAVRGVAAAVDYLALVGQRSLLGQIVGAVQPVEILCDGNSLGVLPGSTADAIARIDRRLAVRSLGAGVGVPSAI